MPQPSDIVVTPNSKHAPVHMMEEVERAQPGPLVALGSQELVSSAITDSLHIPVSLSADSHRLHTYNSVKEATSTIGCSPPATYHRPLVSNALGGQESCQWTVGHPRPPSNLSLSSQAVPIRSDEACLSTSTPIGSSWQPESGEADRCLIRGPSAASSTSVQEVIIEPESLSQPAYLTYSQTATMRTQQLRQRILQQQKHFQTTCPQICQSSQQPSTQHRLSINHDQASPNLRFRQMDSSLAGSNEPWRSPQLSSQSATETHCNPLANEYFLNG
ncbi:unnamed protein product [Protopolystoma xenopodis]|uniref:Uncharacterized protein n=1 Tax=Protopolystoma xenopodis TaxID=117903 RepID=A0A448WPF4_9PLAT|nr:unnamed protein product [Protopolystoma xenopodis]